MAFQKGHKTNLGRKHSAKTKEKISNSCKGRTSYWKGKNNPTKGISRPHMQSSNSSKWKGSDAKYKAIHMWVGRHKGAARTHKCTYCDNMATQWSNIDHKYRRNLDDYKPVCKKCHIEFDAKL
jgi:hypothetical protein